MKNLIGIAAIAALAGAAHGQVVISEILGSTGGSDWEFIEIANIGGVPIDISGYVVELWDSNLSRIPELDASYTVPAATTLAPGAVFTFANDNAIFGTGNGGYDGNSFAGVPFGRDTTLPNGTAIENSAYTAVLTDATTAPILDSWYFPGGANDSTPADPGDFPNRGGTAIAPNFIVPTDGNFIGSGAARVGSSLIGLHFSTPTFGPPELNDGTLEGGTPGYNQIPGPGALALAGVAGLAGARRRRA